MRASIRKDLGAARALLDLTRGACDGTRLGRTSYIVQESNPRPLERPHQGVGLAVHNYAKSSDQSVDVVLPMSHWILKSNVEITCATCSSPKGIASAGGTRGFELILLTDRFRYYVLSG